MNQVYFCVLILTSFWVNASYYDGAPPGDYENYVFAMEWQPEWSKSSCDDDLAMHLPDSYASVNLSVHGLWPNYNPSLHDGLSWPQYCSGTYDFGTYDFTTCEHDNYADSYCSPSAETITAFNVSNLWQSYALEYSWSTLATHEWSKHGSCTGWTSEEYFTQVQAMLYRMAEGQGYKFVSSHVGETVPYEDLYASFAIDTGGKTLALSCDSCSLSEVWTAWALDPATRIPTTPIDIEDSSSCASCTDITIVDWTPCANQPTSVPALECDASSLGPECVYNYSSGALNTDQCDGYPGCLRCAKSVHDDRHYCTDVPGALN